MKSSIWSPHPLHVVREVKVSDVLGDRAGTRLEASGVCAHDGAYYVIFDNTSGIARITDLTPGSGRHDLLPAQGGRESGFEDITFDPVTGHFYVLIEAVGQPSGAFMAVVQEHELNGRYVGSSVLDFPLPRPNKGLEGLTCLERDGQTYLLGMCEGNRCRAGAAGRQPGGGRIQLFTRGRKKWDHVGTVRLPREVDFVDYASLTLSGDRIAVVSQASSALWFGRISVSRLEIADVGVIHEFPRDEAGHVTYCNVEGVSWAGDKLVMVSDRAKRATQKARCQAKDESIHLFELPVATVDQAPAVGRPRAMAATVQPAAKTVGADQARADGSPVAAEVVPGLRSPVVLGLFQRRIAGDDALLRLARLRFDQVGMGAEVYADNPDELEWLLGFAPEGAVLPSVHLNRRLDILQEHDRESVTGFAERFAGRVSCLVVHDQSDMVERTDAVVAQLEDLARRLAHLEPRPTLFLEYAAGHELDWFATVGQRLQNVEEVSMCLDIGHIGIRHARRCFTRRHSDLDLTSLHLDDPRLPDLVDDVDEAVAAVLPAVLDLIGSLDSLGKGLHFHLHDGHPLVDGLADHFSFLARFPISFEHRGRWSLDPLYGPAGLAQVVAAAGAGPGPVPTMTLEIHEHDGRLPLADAAPLFRHWQDLTNAERMNHWLAVLADNHAIATLSTAPAGRSIG